MTDSVANAIRRVSQIEIIELDRGLPRDEATTQAGSVDRLTYGSIEVGYERTNGIC